VRGASERRAFDATAAIFSPEPGSLVWEGDAVLLAEPEERMLWILASPVFRTRFAAQWQGDPIDADDEDEDDE